MKPKSINILGVDYEITYVAIGEKVSRNEGGYLGHINHIERKIRILDGPSPSLRFQVLLHEILHAIDEELDVGALSKESTVKRLAVVLGDTLVRNGLVVLGRE